MFWYDDDFASQALNNLWADTLRSYGQRYVVQTKEKVIQRCLLMTTDPGDLVIDPTCGSGTTAVMAEQWGRRWITIDTSRVAVAIARQRILTNRYEYYALKRTTKIGIAGNLTYKKVPHMHIKEHRPKSKS